MSIKRSTLLMLAAVTAVIAANIAVTQFPRIWSPEHRLSDWMVTFFSPVVPADPEIVLVTVRDDLEHRQRLSSLLPTDRAHLAKLTRCISDSDARVIGFDMLFDWPDAEGLPKLERGIKTASKSLPIVVGTTGDTSPGAISYADTLEIERFASAAGAKVGIIDLVESGAQGTVRNAVGDEFSNQHRSFAALVADLSGLPVQNTKPLHSTSFRIAWAHSREKRNGESIRFTDYSSLDVLDICEDQGASGATALLGSKIVLVGSRAQRDHHAIPFSTLPEYADGMSGLEIHATIIAQTLRGPHIIVPGRLLSVFLAMLAAAIGLYVHTTPALRTRKKFVLVGVGFAITTLTWGAYAILHLLVPLSMILIAMTNGAFIEQAAQGTYLNIRRFLSISRGKAPEGKSP